MQLRNRLFRILFGCALFAFTAYVLLDTFVIVRKYETADASSSSSQTVVAETVRPVETAVPESTAETILPVSVITDDTQTEASVSAVVSTETTYRDGNISIVLTEYRISDTTVHVADVQLSSAEYLKTGFAENTYGRNVTETVSEMADEFHAILAINGDYYGARQSGYVIREGVLYRNTAERNGEALVIYRDGSFAIVNESEVSAEQLLADGAWNVLNFGPSLVENGELTVSPSDEVNRAMSSNPRTAIAVVDELHYLFVVSDGRTGDNDGLTLYELATFLKTLGATTAYNLDGGGSSTMVFQGSLINNPTSNGSRTKERSVSDIVYIGY
ncbi:MAG: phosphodiester glycosidase family protein [Clostridia bacterium]|nr:phosphodiester glycosidase family protein [Clostridia bacterium]